MSSFSGPSAQEGRDPACSLTAYILNGITNERNKNNEGIFAEAVRLKAEVGYLTTFGLGLIETVTALAVTIFSHTAGWILSLREVQDFSAKWLKSSLKSSLCCIVYVFLNPFDGKVPKVDKVIPNGSSSGSEG